MDQGAKGLLSGMTWIHFGARVMFITARGAFEEPNLITRPLTRCLARGEASEKRLLTWFSLNPQWESFFFLNLNWDLKELSIQALALKKAQASKNIFALIILNHLI